MFQAVGPSVGLAVSLRGRFLAERLLCCAVITKRPLSFHSMDILWPSHCPPPHQLVYSLDSSSYSFRLQLCAQCLLWPGPTQVLEEIQCKLRPKWLPLCKGGTYCPTIMTPTYDKCQGSSRSWETGGPEGAARKVVFLGEHGRGFREMKSLPSLQG